MSDLWLDAGLLVLLAGSLLSLRRLSAIVAGRQHRAAGRHYPSAGGTVLTPRSTPKLLTRLMANARGYYQKTSRQAGIDPEKLLWNYWATKLVLAVLMPLLLLEIAGTRPIAAALIGAAGLVGLILPDLALLAIRRRRQGRIRAALSYFLDLLVALVHSGTTLEDAFERAGRDIGHGPSHPLADEVALIARELDLGKDRAAAFRALAERTGVNEVKALASALTLGLQRGASVKSVLASQADILRDRRRAEAVKQINRAAIQAIVPTMLCGFPILLLLVLFPAVIEVAEAFKLLKTVWH